MRRVFILASDVIISGLIVMWFGWGRWLDLYGFSARHPKSALEYFQGLVCTGSMLFASLFALLSLMLLYSSSARRPRRLQRAYLTFYGNARTLLGKYSALALSIIVSPAFYFFMWGEEAPGSLRVAGGFLTETLLFFLGLSLVRRFTAAFATSLKMESSEPSGAKHIPA